MQSFADFILQSLHKKAPKSWHALKQFLLRQTNGIHQQKRIPHNMFHVCTSWHSPSLHSLIFYRLQRNIFFLELSQTYHQRLPGPHVLERSPASQPRLRAPKDLSFSFHLPRAASQIPGSESTEHLKNIQSFQLFTLKTKAGLSDYIYIRGIKSYT